MRKLKKCPYCKSKTGFIAVYKRKGHMNELRTFSGELKDTEVYSADKLKHTECAECGRTLDSRRIRI